MMRAANLIYIADDSMNSRLWALPGIAPLQGLLENIKGSSLSLERARLQAAPWTGFKDLGHGYEAVPVPHSNAENFSASHSPTLIKSRKHRLQPLR
jgi:hypothetical protein